MILFGIFDALRAMKKNMVKAWTEDKLWVLIDLILIGLSCTVLFTMI